MIEAEGRAHVWGTYGTQGEVLARFPAGRIEQVPLDRSDDTSAGMLVAAEFVDGKVWQAGIGVEHLFPRSVSGQEGRFSFTSAYHPLRSPGLSPRRISPHHSCGDNPKSHLTCSSSPKYLLPGESAQDTPVFAPARSFLLRSSGRSTWPPLRAVVDFLLRLSCC